VGVGDDNVLADKEATRRRRGLSEEAIMVFHAVWRGDMRHKCGVILVGSIMMMLLVS